MLKRIYEGKFTQQQVNSAVIVETPGEIYDDQHF